MTQSDLDSIAVDGLINHINQGGTPPNADYVKALQKRWKAFAEHENIRDCGIQPVIGKDCHVRKHHRTSDSSEETLELSSYSALLHEHLNWETRENFLQLQEKLLENKLTIGAFCQAFSERDLLNSEAADMLQSNLIFLSPHKKSLDFSKLTDEILEACYGYDPDPESIEIREKEQKEFRNLVQRIYLQLQKLLKE